MLIIPIMFPPYDDELLLSWLNRLAAANDMTLNALYSLFIDNATKENVGRIGKTNNPPYYIEGLYWCSKKNLDFPSEADLFFNHTMIPAGYDDKAISVTARITQYLLYNGKTRENDVHVKYFTPKLKYCPECYKEDDGNNEHYLRVYHQLDDIKICVRHGCALKSCENLEVFNADKGIIEEISDKNKEIDYANRMYELYLSYRLDGKNTDYDTMELINTNLSIITNKKHFSMFFCKKCGLKFWNTRYAVEIGRGCPECEENVLEHQLELFSDKYVYIQRPHDISERNCVMHTECGKLQKKTLTKILWDRQKCNCSKKKSKEELKEHFGLYDYDILEVEYGSAAYRLKLKHKKCSHVFSRWMSKNKKVICPCCSKILKRERNKQKFIDFIYSLCGDEYEMTDDIAFKDNDLSVKMKHNVCNNIFKCTPNQFRHGKKCPYCKSRVRHT